MNYNSLLEKKNFVDGINFTRNDPCVWVVYPAGGAGDLMSTVLLKHYCNPAAEFFGIDNTGTVIFRDSNYRHYNRTRVLDNSIIDKVNQHLSDNNCNYSVTDQIFFSNHSYNSKSISQILDFFIQSKIIRIIPKTTEENDVINWLSDYKNKNIITPFSISNSSYTPELINNPRVLNVWFGDILNEHKFDQAYDKIINFLNLPYKLVRHDFIKFWLSKQHPIIQPALKLISS